MGLKASIQAAAKAAVLTDAADLQGLVTLGELLRQLAADASTEGVVAVASQSLEAAELSDRIVLRQVDDVAAAFNRPRGSMRPHVNPPIRNCWPRGSPAAMAAFRNSSISP